MTQALTFFLDRYKSELPSKTHSRDTNEAGGPEWHRAFESWLTDGDGKWSTAVTEDQDHCQHPTAENPCPVCDGSGLRIRVRSTFRHPVKRTLDQLAAVPVPKGRPNLKVTLLALAENDGHFGLTISALRSDYSYFWSSTKGRRWLLHALHEFQRCYREDAPARVLGKSESQQIAEVAA